MNRSIEAVGVQCFGEVENFCPVNADLLANCERESIPDSNPIGAWNLAFYLQPAIICSISLLRVLCVSLSPHRCRSSAGLILNLCVDLFVPNGNQCPNCSSVSEC